MGRRTNIKSSGNALGYGQSVTTGVVSALNREVTIDDVTTKMIQIDAAINGMVQSIEDPYSSYMDEENADDFDEESFDIIFCCLIILFCIFRKHCY